MSTTRQPQRELFDFVANVAMSESWNPICASERASWIESALAFSVSSLRPSDTTLMPRHRP